MQAGALNVFKPHGVATELFPVVFYCEFRHVWRSIQPVAPNIFLLMEIDRPAGLTSPNSQSDGLGTHRPQYYWRIQNGKRSW